MPCADSHASHRLVAGDGRRIPREGFNLAQGEHGSLFIALLAGKCLARNTQLAGSFLVLSLELLKDLEGSNISTREGLKVTKNHTACTAGSMPDMMDWVDNQRES